MAPECLVMGGHGTVVTSTMLFSHLFDALFSTCTVCLIVVSVRHIALLHCQHGQWLPKFSKHSCCSVAWAGCFASSKTVLRWTVHGRTNDGRTFDSQLLDLLTCPPHMYVQVKKQHKQQDWLRLTADLQRLCLLTCAHMCACRSRSCMSSKTG